MQQPYDTGGSPATPGAARPTPEDRLKAERVQKELAALPRWALEENGTALTRSYRFKSPQAALAFAAFLGTLAAETGHYPVVTTLQRNLFCRISSTEVGELTERDFELAKRISLLD
jgi:4a-hydroxytetrahydrobiopterin dehydratase